MRIQALFFLLLLIVFSSCETLEPRPEPPAGSFVFGNKLNQAAYDIMEMDDGGFLLLGGSQDETGGDYDVYLVRTDSKGDLLWEKSFRKNNTNEYGIFIREMPDAYAVMAFKSGTNNGGSGNFVLMMLDRDFNKQWERIVPGVSYTYGTESVGSGFFVLDNGNFILSGTLNSEQSYMILDANGSVIEQKSWFPNSYSYWSRYPEMVRLNDGGFMYALPSQGSAGQTELWVKFLDVNGQEKFSTTLPYSGSQFEISEIGQRPDSSFYFYLESYNNDGLQLLNLPDLVNFNPTTYEVGNSIYIRSGSTLPNGNSLLAAGPSSNIASSNDGNFIIHEVNPTGDLVFSKTFGGSNSDLICRVIRSSDDRNVLFGQTQSYGEGGTDFYLIID